MNLDHRASRAARGIKAGVAGATVPPPPGASPAVVAGAPWMRAVMAAAAVVVVGAFVAMVGSPGVFAPSTEGGDPTPIVADTTTTTEAPKSTTTEAPKPTTTTEAPKPTTTTQAPKPTTTTEASKPTTAPKKAPAPSYAITITAPNEGLETDGKGVSLRAEVTPGMEIKMHGVAVEAIGGVVEGWILLEPGWNELWVKGYVNGEKVAYDTVRVYRATQEAFAVDIKSPASGTVTEAEKIVVSGTATPGVGDLKVHGQPVEVGANGSWSAEVWLDGGKTEIWAKLYVNGEKVAYDTVLVERKVAQTVAFTSNQVYGSCSDNPPYDVFHGTATPGHEIKVWSDTYGYQKTTADESGHWEIKYTFPKDIPAHTAIPLKVWNYTTGEKHPYSFTYTPTG